MADTLDRLNIHIVEEKDTLIDISQKYYGTPLLWEIIKAENETPEKPLDPRRLRPGTELIIPGIPQLYWLRQAELIKNNRISFQVYSPFQGRDEKFASTPFLIPPIPPESQFATELKVSVENVFTESGERVQAAIENEDFKFEWEPDPAIAKKHTDIDARITIKANNVWKTGRTERDALKANFADFLVKIELLEMEGTVLPGGTAILTQMVAEGLPASLDETLFFRYGFNPGFGPDSLPFVDLLPGMCLRIEYSLNQYIGPGSGFNGPVGSGQNFYTIGRNRDQLLTFDAFLGSISAPEIPFSSTNSFMAGSLVDLFAADKARRHYRLFYPAQMSRPDSAGDSIFSHNIVIMGADTLADLRTATDTYTTSGDILMTSSVCAFTLRGRSIVIPEIGISVNLKIGPQVNQLYRQVPLGTTVRQVMDGLVPGWHPNVFLAGGVKPVTLGRLFSLTNGMPAYRQIILNKTPNSIIDSSVFDLPFVMGDNLNVSLAAR